MTRLRAYTELSERQREQRREAILARRDRVRDTDIVEVMRSPAGRRFVWWVLRDLCRPELPAHDPSIKDGDCARLHAALEDGRKFVGRDLAAFIEDVAISEFLQMKAEAVEAEQEELMLDIPGSDTSSKDDES